MLVTHGCRTLDSPEDRAALGREDTRIPLREGERVRALWVLLILVLGCGPEASPDAPEAAAAPAPVTLDDSAAMSCPLGELDRARGGWSALAAASVGTGEGVHAGREAARLSRIASYRLGETAPLEEARALLREASLRRAVPGACEASLDLARLQARDLRELPAAYETAYRAIRRFRDPADAACATEARRILSTLEGHRPDGARLAAIDADPDRDDPSSYRGAEPTAGSSALEAWARARSVPLHQGSVLSLVAFGETGASGARVVVTLDRVVEFGRDELAADGDLPRRLVLTLPGARLDPAVRALVAVGAGGLARVRSSADDAGVRVVFDLDESAEPQLYALPDPFRIVVDVSPGSSRAPGEPERTLRLVVLDPGHGGNDYGARAFGLHEADLTLDLALRVRSSLLALQPDLRVVMTRENDTFVSLEQRAAMANAIGADVFVSIHLNAADEPVDHGGITTFVLDTTDDRSAIRLAARENGTGASEVTELQRILAGLHRGEQLAGSRVLAERVHGALLRSGRTVLPRLHDRGVRSAMFYVLVGATMPAVLVEASFMTREDEARALGTDRYRDAIAAGIAEGILAYDD